MKILEGGNVFKLADGQSATQRIAQTDVKPTLAWLEHMLPDLDLQNNTLGSTGIKDTSGDLDIAVDANKITKEQLLQQLEAWCISQGLKPQDWIKKSGTAVHFKTPIDGRPDRGFVQTDFMFMKDVPWSKFVLGAMPADSKYKGRERNVLMNSIAKSMGYKLNQLAGIADRDTNTLITNDPDRVAKLLLNKTATRQDLASVETILQALSTDPARDAKLADFRAHMEREGLPFMESTETADPYIEYSDVNFLARLRDRIVNQGMQKLIESDIQGGRAKGIEHLEDYVFRNGSDGIKRAMDIIKHTTADTGRTTTVKWDGKPALIFGRDQSGDFILTDVAGFGARGYDGMFKSPKQVRKHLAARDAEAAAQGRPATRVETLAPIYDKLWPRLEAAVPKGYQGFFQGDLLYTNTPEIQAGNYVFTPNTVEYKIPVASDVGKRIGASDIGIAMHTRFAEAGAPKEPIGTFKFKTVPGLLLLEPVYAKQNVRVNRELLSQLREVYNKGGDAIDQLFNPADLRALQITDLPRLCVDYINSRVGGTFDNMLAGFGAWLQQHVTPRKFANIVEYLQSPRSNIGGMAAAFTAWVLLHDIKMDLLQPVSYTHLTLPTNREV